MLSEAYTIRPYGLSYHLFFAVTHYFGLGWNYAAVFGSFLLIGVFVLITLDEYKQLHGVLLLIVTGLGVIVLWQRGEITFIGLVPLGSYSATMIAGLIGGITFAGIRYNPSGSGSSLSHDLTSTTADKSPREFNRALPRAFYLVSAIVLIGLFERIFTYDSPIVFLQQQVVTQPITLDAILLGESMSYVLASGFFLTSLFLFRSNTHDKEIIVIGATGTGKSTMMAGLNYSIPEYKTSSRRLSNPNPPLRVLTERLSNDGFEGFPSTPNDQVLPLKFTYKHGILFPRKVTIRTFDYAGDHIKGLRPWQNEEDTITNDMDEAFDAANYLLRQATAGGEGDEGGFYDVEWFGGRDGVGKDPRNFDDVDDDESNSEIVQKLIKDMIWFSDSIGLIYPLEDYADPAVEDGTIPSYVDVDDGSVVQRRRRKEYVGTYDLLCKEYPNKDVFYITTFADLAINDFELQSRWSEREISHLNRWDLFTDHIKQRFLNIGKPGGSKVVNESYDLVPVYFPVTNEEPPADSEDGDEGEGEYDIELNTSDSRLPLHGAEKLLDRMGEE